MPSSTPSPDRFQREIDDIIRLAEKRLERKSPRARGQRVARDFSRQLSRLNVRLPSAELLAGWGLALLLASWLFSLFRLPGTVLIQALGVALLLTGIVLSLTRRGGTRLAGGQEKMWRGERISYGNPYSSSRWLRQIRRFFTPRRY